MRLIFAIIFSLLIYDLYAQDTVSLKQELGTPPRFALVLSGGGARGFAHIGVLDILDSAGIIPDFIVGTSMGAVIGGLYAAGYSPKELEKFAVSTNWDEIFEIGDDSKRNERSLSRKDEANAILSLRFTGFFHPVLPKALSSGQRLTMLLNSYIIRSPFGTQENFLRDMRVPFTAIATDIVTGTRKLFTRGDLTSALRSSSTVPLRFNPLFVDSAIYVDGGLLSNVPVDIARDSAGAAYIIAVNTTSELRPRTEIKTPIDVADQVVTLMMKRNRDEQLSRADIVITPDVSSAIDDFADAKLIIEAGRNAARQWLTTIAAKVRNVKSVTPSGDGDTLIPVLLQCNLNGISPSERFELENIVAPRRGSIITERILRDVMIRDILDTLRRKGYVLARIPIARIYPHQGRIDLDIDRGEIGEVEVHSSGSVDPDQVRRIFPLSDGDIFRSDQSERGIRDLTATGYFSFASLDIEHRISSKRTGIVFINDTFDAPLPVESRSALPSLHISVEPKALNVLRLGLLADNEFGAQFSAEYANENFLTLDADLSIKGGIGPESRYYWLGISTPRFLSMFTTFAIGVYGGYTDIPVYTISNNIPKGRIYSDIGTTFREANDVSAMIRFGGEVGKLASLTGEFRTEQWRIFDIAVKNVPTPITRINAARAEFIIDSRNDADYPASGNFGRLYYELATKQIGSDVSYTKVYGEFESAVALSSLHTIRPRIEIGLGDRTLPLPQSYTIGGLQSFYGLYQYEKRGRQIISASLGYQIRLPYIQLFPTFFAVRYDVGSVWAEPRDITFDELVHGIGIQMGFKTPIGIVAFGIGENFAFAQSDTKPLLLNTPRFYFRIGSKL